MTGMSRFMVNEAEVAAKVMDGEAILIDLSSGKYYSMDLVGGFVWSLLSSQHSVEETIAAVTAHYEVAEEQAATDVKKLLDELQKEKLIVASNAESAAVAAPAAPAEKSEYTEPKLYTYEDMGDLLALDPPMPGLTEVPWEGADNKTDEGK